MIAFILFSVYFFESHSHAEVITCSFKWNQHYPHIIGHKHPCTDTKPSLCSLCFYGLWDVVPLYRQRTLETIRNADSTLTVGISSNWLGACLNPKIWLLTMRSKESSLFRSFAAHTGGTNGLVKVHTHTHTHILVANSERMQSSSHITTTRIPTFGNKQVVRSLPVPDTVF